MADPRGAGPSRHRGDQVEFHEVSAGPRRQGVQALRDRHPPRGARRRHRAPARRLTLFAHHPPGDSMAHTYPELKAKPLAELREIAAGIQHHEVKGIDKGAAKAKIHEWQKKRDEALAAKDRKALKVALNHIHHFKHALRKAMV